MAPERAEVITAFKRRPHDVAALSDRLVHLVATGEGFVVLKADDLYLRLMVFPTGPDRLFGDACIAPLLDFGFILPPIED